MASRTLSATVLCCLIALGMGKPSFNHRNRPTLRGIVATKVELPCMVHNARHSTVSWTHNGAVLSEDRTLKTSDPRFSMRPEDGSDTWMMEIEPSAASDAGQYECVVTLPNGQQMKKVFTLEIVEQSSEVLWRWDSRCGGANTLEGFLSHVTAQCDGQGTYPCCSRWGWCGFSRQHCDCYGCVDYSKKPIGACTTPFSRLLGADMCVTFGPSRATYADAEAFCEGLEATLFAHESFNELENEALAIIQGGEEDTKFWVKLPAEDHLSMANLVEGFLSNLLSGEDSSNLPSAASLCHAVSHRAGAVDTHEELCGELLYPVCVKPTRA